MPEAYVRELEPLCMECPVSDFASVRKVLEREYKKPLEEIFKYIDPIPIGSASLAQVHKAELLDGTIVAIKVIIPR
jgi:ubiquinone biosynthesis protein